MRKEIQAAEWLFLIAGLVLLLTGSRYFTVFARLFEAYFFLMTAGMGLWMMFRYLNRYNKKNISVFRLHRPDETSKTLSIKTLQLFAIVFLSIWHKEEPWMILPVGFSLLFYYFQLARYGQPKIVFHGPHLYWDAIFFEDLEVTAFDMHPDGIWIQSEHPRWVAFQDMRTQQEAREIAFVENQLLDDVMLDNARDETVEQFLSEVEQYARKMEILVHRHESKR